METAAVDPRSESEPMRRVRNDGVGRRLLEKQRSGRRIALGVIPVNLAPTTGEAAKNDNKKSTNVTCGAGTLH